MEKMKKNQKTTYLFCDVLLVCLFVAIFVVAFVNYTMVPTHVRATCFFLGLALIYSKALEKFSLIEKALYWVSQNVMVPRTKYNHILGGVFFLLIGILSFLFSPGHRKTVESELLWRSLRTDLSFWILITLILLLNLIIGFYRYKKKARRD